MWYIAPRLGIYRAQLAVEVRVQSKVTTRSNRATVARKTSVDFRGRVQVADLPKRVVLEASTGAGWKRGAVVLIGSSLRGVAALFRARSPVAVPKSGATWQSSG